MRTLRFGALVLVLISLACDTTSVGPLKSNVQVSFATRGPAAAPAPARAPSAWQAASNDTLTDGSNTIVVTKVLVVLGKIELKKAQVTTCDSAAGEGCQEIELGPVLIDLPLVPGAQQQFAVTIPAGTYDEVDFEVHKVTTQDSAALQAAMLNRSIYVEGSYNGQPFAFESALDVERELVMSPAVMVTDTGATNITIHVALDEWFRSVSGGGLLDPRDAANRSAIEEAIKVSLKAFKDDNHDGQIDP